MNVEVFPDQHTLAQAAVRHAITTLSQAISKYGNATWVLAGGSTPKLAYELLASSHLDTIDWSRVTFVMGDERIAPLDSPDSNWHVAEQAFLQHIPHATFLRPRSDTSAESGAGEYKKTLSLLPKINGFPRFDLVWLGMGEDGHTLSLFPNHPDFQPTPQLVIPVHHSPKPPVNRLTLTLAALRGAQTTIILAAGDNKAAAVKQAMKSDDISPIAQAAHLTHATWFVDQAAAKLLT